jgi:hypothetical protein
MYPWNCLSVLRPIYADRESGIRTFVLYTYNQLQFLRMSKSSNSEFGMNRNLLAR